MDYLIYLLRQFPDKTIVVYKGVSEYVVLQGKHELPVEWRKSTNTKADLPYWGDYYIAIFGVGVASLIKGYWCECPGYNFSWFHL